MPSPDSNPSQPSKEPTAPSQSGPPSILVDVSRQEHQKISTSFVPRTGAKLAVGAILVVLVLSGSFLYVQYRRSRRESDLQTDTTAATHASITVEVATVKYGPETQTLTQPGHIHAWYETTIYARVSGYLHNWSADIGDRVKDGQVLATIDTPELDDQLSAAQAKLKVSEANVNVAQTAADFAKTTYDRYWISLKDEPPGVVSEQEKDETKAGYDSSLAKLEAAKSQVNLDEADVKSLTELSGFKEVRAPFDGVITARRIDLGDLVTAGSTASTTSLYSIAQYDKVRVFVDVPQEASMAMTVDTPAEIVASEYPGRKFEGKVERTASAIDQTSKELHVEVDVANSDFALLPGMDVNVGFAVKKQPLLQVPASALIFRSNGPQIAVVDKTGQVSFHNVTIGSDHGDFVEIASGLSPNDQVALNLSNQVAEGDHVTATNMDTPSPSAPPTSTTTASTK
jgi:RND family efflux transporter MFP subunit